jgi:hypothetical protein
MRTINISYFKITVTTFSKRSQIITKKANKYMIPMSLSESDIFQDTQWMAKIMTNT